MIRSVVRVKPLLDDKRARTSSSSSSSGKGKVQKRKSTCSPNKVVSIVSEEELRIKVKDTLSQEFKFSKCFGPETRQKSFFEESGMKDMVCHALNGYSATIFTYGQTGSGKTFTVFGKSGGSGCFGRALHLLFTSLQLEQYAGTTISLSSIEIYNDKLNDLFLSLDGVKKEKNHKPKLVWSQRDKGFIVKGASFVNCESQDRAVELLTHTMMTRRVGSHDLNAKSNRSHCVTVVYLTNKEKNTFGKLTFCDLAGSERLHQTNSTNTFESGQINKSLFTLSKVIRALEANHPNPPYRDSALTKLLSSSLGGNNIAMMIACVSSVQSDCEETMRTLQFAARTQKIRNTPVIFRSKHEQLVYELRTKIKELEHQNAELRTALEKYRDDDHPQAEVNEQAETDEVQVQYHQQQKPTRPESPKSTSREGGGVSPREKITKVTITSSTSLKNLIQPVKLYGVEVRPITTIHTPRKSKNQLDHDEQQDGLGTVEQEKSSPPPSKEELQQWREKWNMQQRKLQDEQQRRKHIHSSLSNDRCTTSRASGSTEGDEDEYRPNTVEMKAWKQKWQTDFQQHEGDREEEEDREDPETEQEEEQRLLQERIQHNRFKGQIDMETWRQWEKQKQIFFSKQQQDQPSRLEYSSEFGLGIRERPNTKATTRSTYSSSSSSSRSKSTLPSMHTSTHSTARRKPTKKRAPRPMTNQLVALQQEEKRHMKNVVGNWIVHHRNRNSNNTFVF